MHHVVSVVQQPHQFMYLPMIQVPVANARLRLTEKRIGGLKYTPELRSLRAVLAPGVVFGNYEPTKSRRVYLLQLLRRGLPGLEKI